MPTSASPLPVLSEVLQLGADRRSGRLRVRDASGDRTIYFVRGVPELVTSTVAGERMGEMLARAGLVGENEIPAEVAAARSAGRRLDAHLVATGRVSSVELHRAVVDASIRLLATAYFLPRAELLFTALDRPVDDDMQIGLPPALTHELLARRLGEEAFRNLWRSTVRLTHDAYRLLAFLPLRPSDRPLIDRLREASAPPQTLAAVHGQGRDAGLRTLAWLTLSGIVVDGELPPSGPRLPAEIPWNAVSATDLRAQPRLDAAAIERREETLALLDRERNGLPRAEIWSAAARLHPDQAFRPGLEDLATRLHFVFPRLFSTEAAAPNAAPPTDDRSRRILRRKVVSSHLELAAALAEREPAKAFDLLERCLDLEPERTDVASRLRNLARARPELAPELAALAGRHPTVLAGDSGASP